MEGADESEEQPAREEGQRRHVTLLFCDLCDYTQLNELFDPEQIDDLQRSIEAEAALVIERHGGAISQYFGDGILAVFGLPVARELDARAAVNAALELRAVPARCASGLQLPAGVKLGMHFGVHCGLVFARRGDFLHGRYQLTGDAVTTAARLCASAERDQVLVSEAALRGIEPFFHTDVARALTLRGKRLSVPAYRIYAQSKVQTRYEASAHRGLTELVGRERELTQLRAAISAAANGGGDARCIALHGSAGMGKTRVLAELAQSYRTSEVQIYRGHCDSYGSVLPLQPLLSILRQMLELGELSGEHARAALHRRCRALQQRELAPDLDAHIGLFETVLALESGDACNVNPALEQQLVQALSVLLPALGAKLVVLAIDDFQWVDDLSHRVLRGLLRALPSGVQLLVATREMTMLDGVLAAARKVELSPLSPEDCGRVIRALVPGTLELGLTQVLSSRTGGNPLFLEELCRALSRELPGWVYAPERPNVPNTIQGVIQARLERLPAAELRVLRVAAVIGNELSKSLLVEVAAADGDIAVSQDNLHNLDALCATGLIRELEGTPGHYRFNHGITREVVYSSVRLDERRKFHAAVASRLEQRAADGGLQAQHEALAHHFVGSGDHARAAHHAELAGDRALAAAALDRARAQYEAALAELDKLAQTDTVKRTWLAVSLKWARAAMFCPAPEHLLVLQRAARLAEALPDLNALVDVAHVACWTEYALGDQQASIDHCQRGLMLADEIGNHKQVGQLTSNLGNSLAAAGDYEEALPLLERALQLKRIQAPKKRASVPIGFGYALAVSATIHADRGEFALAEQDIEQGLAAMSGSGHPVEASMLGLWAMAQLWRGDLYGCIGTCQRAAAAAERVSGPYVFCISEVMSTYGRYVLTRDLEQYQRLCHAVDWLDAHSMRLYLSMACGCAAQASLIAGRPECARRYAQRALERAKERDPFGAAIAYRVLAELRAQELSRCDDEVLAWLSQADISARQRGSRRELVLNELCRLELLKRFGAGAEAEASYSRVRRELESMGMVVDQAHA